MLACTINEKDFPPEVIENFNEDGLHYLALGDSYTIGTGIKSNGSWPVQLVEVLSEEGYPIEDPTIVAKVGWTSNQLINAIDTVSTQQYDLVSLLIGVNNQFIGEDFSVFENELVKLVESAISFTKDGESVCLVSIPDYGVTPFGASNSETIAEELDQYNAFIESTATAYQLPYVDITTLSRNLADNSVYLASDNLHPSAAQYQLWVDLIAPVLKDLLVE